METSTQQKVLIVDDSPVNRQVLSELLKQDYLVMAAKSGEQALEKAFQQAPDLILLDVMMPGMDGHEVLRRLKEDARTASTGVIFITGLDSAEDEERGLLLGASDYITKPFSAAVVRARVALHLKLARQRLMLESLAHIDGLTEIPNRRYFDDALAREAGRAHRSGNGLAVALIDVDFFKQYNDHYGHAMGDRVLQSVAKALRDSLKRHGDMVARYGGEEFVLLMPQTDAHGALELAERARQAVEGLAIAHEKSEVAPSITVSTGVACSAPVEELPADVLMLKADQRLYVAKRSGRNRVVGHGE